MNTSADPTLTISTNSLTGFNYVYNSGSSEVQSFTVAGSSLTGDIVITPSGNYEISENNNYGFDSTAITIHQYVGSVDSTRIYVRLKAGLDPAFYQNILSVTSNGAISNTINVNGTVTPEISIGNEDPILITSSSSLVGFNYVFGAGPSAVQSFTVEGSSLMGDIVITPSGNYEISENNNYGFDSTAITIHQYVGSVDSSRIYVRLKAGLETGTYENQLHVTSTGAEERLINFVGTVSVNIVYGCTDSLAINYNYLAAMNDGSCRYKTDSVQIVYGCTDSLALNYNHLATMNDGSCTYNNDSIQIVYGCTDSLALNYNRLATMNNGSCRYKNDSIQVVYGCMKPSAKNYNSLATKDDGTCKYDTIIVISGCTKKAALNYNSKATIDNGSCLYDTTKVIVGCTDKKATNYNALATVNNGSCKYDSTTVVYGCTDPTAMNYNSYAKITNNNCIYKAIIPGCTDLLALNYNATASVNDGTCKYEAKIWGCTDPLAENYNSKANHNDGYCTYAQKIKGCTDAAALNYNSLANQENGSCIYNQNIALGCIDTHAQNYNPYANKDNGSCIYVTISDTIKGCTDATALNYNPIAMQTDNSQCIYNYNTTTPISGCMSRMALNYNNKAVIDDGSCVFAKPMNLVTVIIPETTILADTLSMVQDGFCSFDYSIPIDTVYIISTETVTETQLEVTWGVRQGTNVTSVKQVYSISKDGNSLLYLSLICKNSATLIKGLSKMSSSQSSSQSLNAITFSAVLESEGGTSALAKLQTSNRLKVYPVPVRNEMHIAFTSEENEQIQYSVFSLEGIRVSTGQLNFVNGQNQSILTTSAWSSGMYMIQLYREGQVIDTQKFVKE